MLFLEKPCGAYLNTFDPTNRGVGGSSLIPVAIAHNIWQAMPVNHRVPHYPQTGLILARTQARPGSPRARP